MVWLRRNNARATRRVGLEVWMDWMAPDTLFGMLMGRPPPPLGRASRGYEGPGIIHWVSKGIRRSIASGSSRGSSDGDQSRLSSEDGLAVSGRQGSSGVSPRSISTDSFLSPISNDRFGSIGAATLPSPVTDSFVSPLGTSRISPDTLMIPTSTSEDIIVPDLQTTEDERTEDGDNQTEFATEPAKGMVTANFGESGEATQKMRDRYVTIDADPSSHDGPAEAIGTVNAPDTSLSSLTDPANSSRPSSQALSPGTPPPSLPPRPLPPRVTLTHPLFSISIDRDVVCGGDSIHVTFQRNGLKGMVHVDVCIKENVVARAPVDRAHPEVVLKAFPVSHSGSVGLAMEEENERATGFGELEPTEEEIKAEADEDADGPVPIAKKRWSLSKLWGSDGNIARKDFDVKVEESDGKKKDGRRKSWFGFPKKSHEADTKGKKAFMDDSDLSEQSPARPSRPVSLSTPNISSPTRSIVRMPTPPEVGNRVMVSVLKSGFGKIWGRFGDGEGDKRYVKEAHGSRELNLGAWEVGDGEQSEVSDDTKDIIQTVRIPPVFKSPEFVAPPEALLHPSYLDELDDAASFEDVTDADADTDAPSTDANTSMASLDPTFVASPAAGIGKRSKSTKKLGASSASLPQGVGRVTKKLVANEKPGSWASEGTLNERRKSEGKIGLFGILDRRKSASTPSNPSPRRAFTSKSQSSLPTVEIQLAKQEGLHPSVPHSIIEVTHFYVVRVRWDDGNAEWEKPVVISPLDVEGCRRVRGEVRFSVNELVQLERSWGARWEEAARFNARTLMMDPLIAEDITIDDEKIEAFLQNLDVALYNKLSQTEAAAMPLKFDSVQQEVNFLSLFFLMNFGSGWRVELHECADRGAFDTIRFGLMSMHISAENMNSSFLRDVQAHQVASYFDLPYTRDVAHPTMPGVTLSEAHPIRPFIQKLTQVMNETGKSLLEKGYSAGLGAFVLDVTKPGPDGPKSAQEVVRALVAAIPGFRDFGKVRGRDVYILKKAQLLVMELARRFGPKDPTRFAFKDIENLTVGADNVIPCVLIQLNILKPSPALFKMIQDQVDFGSSDVEAGLDWILRGAAIEASDRIVLAARVAREKGTLSVEIKTTALETYLWMLGKEPEFRPTKRPVNKQTVFY
ncbi:hypothetical protein HDU97_007763 [Phlyctochytrium planicorne]|nr:hypothetical protein HDU97_007763 [Phlyctochytrium planicorne]